MRTRTILAFVLLLAVQAGSQAGPKRAAQAQCKFSDGTKIRVLYSQERQSYLFKTDEGLITIKGVRVASGDYTVSTAKDEYNNWTLRMRKPTLKSLGALPALTMSIATKELTSDSFPVVFEHTGGSCKMYWRQNEHLLLSLEFTRENADIPVLNWSGGDKF
jgi:hypothetical protein